MTTGRKPGRAGVAIVRHAAIAGLIVALAGCGEGEGFNPFKASAGSPADGTARSVKLVERDVEAPEVFQLTAEGLWDGRPSLGGVWAAHPDVKDPERIIIRNQGNGKFVIGALFRKERATPGPALQLSSDAAAALGMLAGQPARLNVTALRREEAPDDTAADTAEEAAGADLLAAAPDVRTETLAPAPGMAAPDAQAAAPEPVPAAPAPAPRKTSTLDKPWLQIGIFSVEENAEKAAGLMREAGMVPELRKQSSAGKTFWRVLVGPAGNASERDALLGKIKARGFADAYAVSG